MEHNTPTKDEHEKAKKEIQDLLSRVQVVELELQFSKKELDETRILYKKLEDLFRDSEQMISRLSTLISVQEEVIKHLQTTVKSKATGEASDIEELKKQVRDLDRFKFKALGVILALMFAAQVVVSYFL